MMRPKKPKTRDHVQGFYSAITPFDLHTILLARLQVAGRVPAGDVPEMLAMLGLAES
jgi:hypothetical protein